MDGETRRARKRALPRITPDDVFASANWITNRDKQICLDLYRHHVLTIHQLSALHFTQPRIARRRLLDLYERRVVRRFQPQTDKGSSPYHYVLGELGAYIVAGYYDLDLKRIRTRVTEDQKLAHSAKLPHLLQVHDFFVRLIKGCRYVAGHRVVRWWSEKRCAAAWCDISGQPMVRPDAQGILRAPSGRCSFLLELDRGTERGSRLQEKFKDYEVVSKYKSLEGRHGAARYPDVLLFMFPSETRELSARRHLVSYRNLGVATSRQGLHERDPLGANWTPVHWPTASGPDDRLSLLDLPALNEGGEAE